MCEKINKTDKTVERLARLQAVATSRGGKCLSTEYLGMSNKHRWECSKGHQWEATGDHVVYHGSWCPVCMGKTKDPNGLTRLQQVAAERGGKCLSTEYLGFVVKHRWECSEGHQWEATPNNIIYCNTWCPVCAGKALDPNGLTRLQQVAAERGGKCLSTEYLGVVVKHRWECSKGHQWESTPDSVIRKGAWCPVCAKKRQSYEISRLQQVAAERGGKCLSTEYLGPKKKLLWECAEGHQWEAVANYVVNHGDWCRACEDARMDAEIEAYLEKYPYP